jgi:RNase P/RNase MRP subunit p30
MKKIQHLAFLTLQSSRNLKRYTFKRFILISSTFTSHLHPSVDCTSKLNRKTMAKQRRPKKPRGSRGERTAQCNGKPSDKNGAACDLMVMLPKDATPLQSRLQIEGIMTRLSSTGFTHMALTHTIYGRPKPGDDKATKAIPSSLWSSEQNNGSEPTKKKRKTTQNPPSEADASIKVLRRIHGVLENLSDVGSYLSNGPDAALLNEYDLISVAPRNEATFQSVCASATMVDIITLDYSSTRGLRLPYKIKAADVQAVMDRGAAFEINFAPALLKSKLRKALVQTCRELQTASLGKKPLVLFSSGDRTYEDSDVGVMALRMPGDLSNLMQVLLQFDPTTANRAVGPTALDVLERAEERRWGKTDIVDVSIGSPKEAPAESTESTTDEKASAPASGLEDKKDDSSEDGGDETNEDGFISMF